MSPEEDVLELLLRLSVDTVGMRVYTKAGTEHINKVSEILGDVVDYFETQYNLKKEVK